MKSWMKRAMLWLGKNLLEFGEQKVMDAVTAQTAAKNPGKDATTAGDA